MRYQLGEYDDGDRFLSSTAPDLLIDDSGDTNDTDSLILSNIEIPQGESTIFILYSMGQNSVGNNPRAKLLDVSSSSAGVIVGGILPAPEISATINLSVGYAELVISK